MGRIKLALAFFALVLCAIGALAAYYYWENYMRPDLAVARRIEERPLAGQEQVDVGRRHFTAALALLEEGELISARDRLIYLLTYFPESASTGEARRIVGEINLDLLLSKIPLPEKTTHLVRPGQAMVTIARNYKTTIDYIMRVNGKTNTLIYAQEELIVHPLTDFRVEIRVADGEVDVLRGDEFFKRYSIVDTHLPPTMRAPISTSISEKVAWFGDRPLNFEDLDYLNATKWIRTGKIGLFIRMPTENLEEGAKKPYGVMLAKSDIEELFTILRNGSSVRLIN
ncbi:MAG: hypothetical protein AAF236_16560 [Verrucomicrobiota bacterium]